MPPPWRLMMSRAIDSPNPNPPLSWERASSALKKGSNTLLRRAENAWPVVENLDFDLVRCLSAEPDGDMAAVLDGIFHDVGDRSR